MAERPATPQWTGSLKVDFRPPDCARSAGRQPQSRLRNARPECAENHVTDLPPLKVYYDGVCPRCIRDRHRYERLAGRAAGSVQWIDVTGNESSLRARGLQPEAALLSLHVEDHRGSIHHGLDAYILLMRRVPVLKPLAWLLALPGIKPVLERIYRRSVRRRLARQGRLP